MNASGQRVTTQSMMMPRESQMPSLNSHHRESAKVPPWSRRQKARAIGGCVDGYSIPYTVTDISTQLDHRS
jgi:hypothetical protein